MAARNNTLVRNGVKRPQATRLYLAVDIPSGETVALIDAPNKQRALAHMARKTFHVKYAEQSDVVAAIKAGIQPEAISAAELQEDDANE